jgi:hypothetical protein
MVLPTPPRDDAAAPLSLARRIDRRRHVLLVLAASAVAATALAPHVDKGDRRAALAAALTARGLVVAPEDAQWIDKPGVVLGAHARAIVRAAPTKGEPNDVYLVETSLSPEGTLLEVGDAYDLTETSSADESRPVVVGARVAYVSRPTIDEASPTVHVLDLSGARPAPDEWSRLERAENAITNLQTVGQLRGIARRTFDISAPLQRGAAPAADAKSAEPPKPAAAHDVTVDLDAHGGIVIHADGQEARVLPPCGARHDGDAAAACSDKPTLPAWIRAEDVELARPGNVVQWAVDRARGVSWIGDDNMQTVKAVAFTLLDFVLRNKEEVTGDTGAKSIAEDLGTTELEPPTRAMPVDPEIGWPPPPLDPWVEPALPGEGQWHPLDKDPFVRRNEGLPPAFVTTFIRSDRTRKATRVYVALWDPRQVELHMMAGTVEPKGATGEAGPGLIPRAPEVMKRVVAASNAGFQALHGEFGMMADGVVYLPPKEYGATVAVLKDGTTGFGTWPGNQQIPPEIVSYRQNMTVMVQDQKWNPYGRTWWGGTPPGWEDKTHTVRTGICLTKERFIGYFYGADLSPEALSQAMIQVRCAYGIALDMNAGHSGLEFYKVAPADELEPLGRPLSGDWEAEGDVPGLDGWKFRGRRFIKGMGLMHFPRYIRREARDFFYMTLRNVLPGPAIEPKLKPAVEGEGEWRVKGLPQHGFPYALALTDVRIAAGREAHVLKIDPRMVSGAGAKDAKTIAIVDAGDAKAGELSVWHSAGAFSVGASAPVPDAVRVATGSAPDAAQGAAAAIGVTDDGAMLVYAELPPSAQPSAAADAKLLDALIKAQGCSQRVLLASALPFALGGDSDLEGRAVRPPTGPSAVRLSRLDGAGAKRIFEDTPIVPLSVWYPLQQHRIRYFKKPAAADAADDK